MAENVLQKYDEGGLSGRLIGWGCIAALGEFLDAYSIVAFSVALVYIDPYYKIPSFLVGLVPAIFGYTWATTALFGGHISDFVGRKYLYMWDMLVMILGSLLMVISSFMYSQVLLILGYAIVGIGVGLDIPASEALLAEIAPRRHRGKMMSLANIWWYIGPITALVIALLTPANIVGFRVLFIFGIAFAIFTLIMRQLLIESPRFLLLKGEIKKLNEELGVAASSNPGVEGQSDQPRVYKWTDLFMPGLVGFTIYIMAMNILWAIPASTFGIYLPYITKDIGGAGFVGAVVTDLIWFLSSIVGLLLYWTYADKPNSIVNRKYMFILSCVMVAIGFVLFGTIPLNNGALGVFSVALIGFFQGFAMWPIIWVWGTEKFPTSIRAAGRGFLSGTDRYANYSWTFVLPIILAAIGLRTVAFILAAMEVVMAIVSIFYAPTGTESKSLEALEKEIG